MKADIAQDYEVYQALKSKSPTSKDTKYFKHFIKTGQEAKGLNKQTPNVTSPKFSFCHDIFLSCNLQKSYALKISRA